MTAIPPFMSATPGPLSTPSSSQRVSWNAWSAPNTVSMWPVNSSCTGAVGRTRQMEVAAVLDRRPCVPAAVDRLDRRRLAPARARRAARRRRRPAGPAIVASPARLREPLLTAAQRQRPGRASARPRRARSLSCRVWTSAPMASAPSPSRCSERHTAYRYSANSLSRRRYRSRLNGTISVGKLGRLDPFPVAEFGMLGGDVRRRCPRRGSGTGYQSWRWPSTCRPTPCPISSVGQVVVQPLGAFGDPLDQPRRIPVSSSSSRSAVAHGSSPLSIPPCGICHASSRIIDPPPTNTLPLAR